MMIPSSLMEIDNTLGCLGFSFLSKLHDGARRTFLYLRDGNGEPQGCVILLPEQWNGGL